MKASIHARLAGSVVLGILAIGSTLFADPGDPGRPIIKNNTLYAADGRKLRGDHVNWAAGPIALNPTTWERGKEIWFNCRRLDANKDSTEGKAPLSCDQCGFDNKNPRLWKAIDSSVNLAARAGQYVMMLYGSPISVFSDELDQAHFREFWALAAPRYKNRTHVFYEMANEPGDSWRSPLSAMPVAHQIRLDAPETPLVICNLMDAGAKPISEFQSWEPGYNSSYPTTPWDWSKGVIGVHPYRGYYNFNAIKAVLPIMNTEIWTGDYADMAQMEQWGICWTYFDGKGEYGSPDGSYDITPLKNYMIQHNCAWWLNPSGTDLPVLSRQAGGSSVKISRDLRGVPRVELTGSGLHQITLYRANGAVGYRAQTTGPGHAALPEKTSGIYLLSVKNADGTVQTTRVTF